MSFLDGIPKTVNYDFFISILGIFMMYFGVTEGNLNQIFNSSSLDFNLFGTIALAGLMFTARGIYLMDKKYKLDNKIRDKERELEMMKLNTEISKKNTEKEN